MNLDEGCLRLKVVHDGDPTSVAQLGIQPVLLQTLFCIEALVASRARMRAETALGPSGRNVREVG